MDTTIGAADDTGRLQLDVGRAFAEQTRAVTEQDRWHVESQLIEQVSRAIHARLPA